MIKFIRILHVILSLLDALLYLATLAADLFIVGDRAWCCGIGFVVKCTKEKEDILILIVTLLDIID